MAKRCGPNNRCSYPRAQFWRQALGIDYYSQSGGGYSSELQTWLNKLTALGYTHPNDTVLSAMDVFIEARRTDGSLSEIEFMGFWAFNDANLSNAAVVDVINPERSAGLVNSPVYGVGGFKGDGVSAYINTNVNLSLSTKYLRDSAARIMYVRTAPLSGSRLDGVISSTSNRLLSLNINNHSINQGNNSLNAAVDLTGTGYIAIDRSDSLNVAVYKGLTKTDRTATSQARDNEFQTVFRSSANYSDAEISIYILSGHLTETQHNNIRNDFLTYLTAIGL